MKTIYFFLATLILASACDSAPTTEETENVQNEVQEEETREKQTRRPSSGGDTPGFLGRVSYEIGDKVGEIKEFKAFQNDVTITEGALAIRIMDMNGNGLIFSVQGPNVHQEAKGNYASVLSGTKDGKKAMVSFMSQSGDIQWREGSLEILSFNPSTGEFKAMLDGMGVDAMKITDASNHPFKLNIDMRFENVVNLLPQ
jgi:hypothetical protein